jgi:hypothetical protein
MQGFRVDEPEEVAAALEPGAQFLHFRGQQVHPRTGDHDKGGVGGHFLGEAQP